MLASCNGFNWVWFFFIKNKIKHDHPTPVTDRFETYEIYKYYKYKLIFLLFRLEFDLAFMGWRNKTQHNPNLKWAKFLQPNPTQIIYFMLGLIWVVGFKLLTNDMLRVVITYHPPIYLINSYL